MNHPITPSPELVHKWAAAFFNHADRAQATTELLSRAAQWGADQELEACCEWLDKEVSSGWGLARQIRAARRPKSPSLKQQALDALHAVASGANDTREQHQDFEAIRRALKALPDA